MADPFIAQIVMFGGTFAPRGWALCDGQLLAISSYSAVLSLLGTAYGGDGRTTFGLPDLRGRVPIHPGTGPGLTAYSRGQQGGAENTTLTINQMPGHTHGATDPGQSATTAEAEFARPEAGMVPAAGEHEAYAFGGGVELLGGSINTETAGGGQSHTNLQPYNCVNFIIALEGTYPSRS